MTTPLDLLPISHPGTSDPSKGNPSYFYDNVVKHLIPDTIRVMSNGLHMDQDAIDDLREVINGVLDKVSKTMLSNACIASFQDQKYPKLHKQYLAGMEEKKRGTDHFIKPYKHTNMIHRTAVVNAHLVYIGKPELTCDKWTVKLLKELIDFTDDLQLQAILDNSEYVDNNIIVQGMHDLAEAKMRIYNKSHYADKVAAKSREDLLPPFNPGSSTQLTEFFEYMKIDPIAFSKDSGNASWGREQVETVLKNTTDEDFIEALQAFVDHSYSAIIRNNFLEAFDRFTIDGVLHGNLKLFGAKSFRYTSNSPNLLNMPSTGSIYAKPLKKCFVAPEGYVVYTIDYSALEDRVIANLSGDKNKLNIFLKGLDGHSLNACGYFKEEIEAVLGPNDGSDEYIMKFYNEVENGNKILKKIRQTSKGPTFKLAYGGYPDADKGGVITQEIFDRYHNDLYPGIANYREKVVIPNTLYYGYNHLGLGCRIYSDNVNDDARTLFNANSQFWSILSILTINKMHQIIDEAGKQDIIKCTSSIYDSIYYIAKATAKNIKWLNDTIVPVMNTDFLEGQQVHNEAVGEVGLNWSDLVQIPNGASEELIQLILDKLKEDNEE